MKRPFRKTVLLGLLLFSLCLPMLASSCSGGKSPYVFRVKNTEIAIDAKAEPILAALGTPVETSIKPSCLFGEENDVLYVYHDFTLMIYMKEKVPYIYRISLKSDAEGLSTPEGISVGDSREKVLSTYGEPAEKASGNLRYDADGMALYFFFSGETVQSVEYRRTGDDF